MLNTLNIRTALVAALLLALASPALAQGRRNLPPLTPEEAELALRYDVQRQLQRRVGVTDSATMQRLITTAVRHSDSTSALLDRESIIRAELNREGYPEPRRAINETRISCLLGELTNVERRRFDLRMAHRTEVASFLPPLSRLQYMGTHQSIIDIVDDRRRDSGQRRTMLERASALPPASPTVPQTRAQIGAAICR